MLSKSKGTLRTLPKILKLYDKVSGSGGGAFVDMGNVTASDVLKLILMTYGYITTEQFMMLFPEVSRELLAFTCCKSRSGGGKSHKVMSSYPYIGHRSVYVMTPAEYDCVRERLEPRYITDHHVRPAQWAKAKKHLEHTVETLNLPYRLLSDDCFGSFTWYGRIRLSPFVELCSTIMTAEEDNTFAGNCRYDGCVLIPDGLMHFEGGGGTVLLEQDMGNEGSAKLRGKHSFYGDYFARFGDAAAAATVIYTVTVSKKGGGRKGSPEGSSGMAQYRQCRDISAEHGCRTLSELSAVLHSTLAQSTKAVVTNRYRKMISLVFQCESDTGKPLTVSTMADLSRYCKERAARRADESDMLSDRTSQLRCRTMSADLTRWVNEGGVQADQFMEAVYKNGLSYVIASKRQTLMYSRYILLHYSRICTDALYMLASAHGVGIAEKGLNPVSAGGVTLKNALQCSDGLGRTAIVAAEEITCDIAGRMRASALARCGCPENIHLLVFAETAAEAQELFAGCDNAGGVVFSYIAYGEEPGIMYDYSPITGAKKTTISHVFTEERD